MTPPRPFLTHRQRLMACGLSRFGADAIPSPTAFRRAVYADRESGRSFVGGRECVSGRGARLHLDEVAALDWQMKNFVLSGALARRCAAVLELTAHDAESLAAGPLLPAVMSPAGLAPRGDSPPPDLDLQAATSRLHLCDLNLAPRIVAAPAAALSSAA